MHSRVGPPSPQDDAVKQCLAGRVVLPALDERGKGVQTHAVLDVINCYEPGDGNVNFGIGGILDRKSLPGKIANDVTTDNTCQPNISGDPPLIAHF
jgi:hypothetical protein